MAIGHKNRRLIEDSIKSRQDFKVANMSGQTSNDGVYRVYSYNTVIASVAVDGTITVDDTKYTVTTSNHQSIVRASLRKLNLNIDRYYK